MTRNPHNAVMYIRRALLDEGPRPDVHRAQLNRLRREWPTLWRAVMATLDDGERAKLGQPTRQEQTLRHPQRRDVPVPTEMPCPVCGRMTRIVLLGTKVRDEKFNISEVEIRCPVDGLHRWTPAPGTGELTI